MQRTIDDGAMRDTLAQLSLANQAFAAAYPGERADRQPVHTVYGGAHLFSSGLARKLGDAALAALREYAPDPHGFARAIGLPEALGATVYARVVDKLEREPVEDHRLDFEDGYGNRPDAEEDGHALAAAQAVATGHASGTLPPCIGIRIKPLTEELRARSLRTLALFLETLYTRAGRLPPRFVVTLPKVTVPEQVTALVTTLAAFERAHGLADGTVEMELMVETPQSLFGARGEIVLPALVAAARGRCRGAHFGVYDYTAALQITAMHQRPGHPACDFARHVMLVSLSGTAVTLSDGATTVMPVGPHRAAAGATLTREQADANRAAVHHAWRTHYRDVRAALERGFYQGWDLHPAQLPTRYAAVFAFFLEAKDEASERLHAFVARAAQATRVGSVFDDAATGQGLLNFFLRGINCGALSEAEALATGLTLEELRSRSFARIMNARRETSERQLPR